MKISGQGDIIVINQLITIYRLGGFFDLLMHWEIIKGYSIDMYIATWTNEHTLAIAIARYLCIKTHSSESRGQEEAACTHVFWPTRPLQ